MSELASEPMSQAVPGSDPGISASRRLRVVISAYACGPGDESEANAGWEFARAAAVNQDVWLLTKYRFEAEITAVLEAEPTLADHLTVHYLDLSERVQRFKKRGFDVYWYYLLWQREVGRVANRLHRDVNFDVAHHITFAVDWLPCGLRTLRGVPLVWGPVGGATYTPVRLLRWFGFRGAVNELVRGFFTRTLRRVWGDPTARAAAIVVAQNNDVARRFAFARRVVVESNSALGDIPPRAQVSPEGRSAIFVGRLLGWKGCRIAVTAMADPQLRDWTLDLYGSGPDADNLRALAARLGVADRITFKGQRPRSEILLAYGRANAMLFPSMHDSAGWAVGEAVSAGCPVVCLDLGGPPIMAGPNGTAVTPSRTVVVDLARALVAAGRRGGEPSNRWSRNRLPALVRDWYRDAVLSSS